MLPISIRPPLSQRWRRSPGPEEMEKREWKIWGKRRCGRDMGGKSERHANHLLSPPWPSPEENLCSPRDTILSGKQDYKKTKSALKATRLKAEAKKNSSGFRDAFLVIAAILLFVLCVYAFFYLNLSTEINLDLDMD
ncbi:Triple QxxK/R motif-containing protein [Nibea albiflora]|uniref:Triple QxxK/R motif-containing protein n=1 Tax=Nibea albiflora TaxID=240163 RepID=A0ACB7EWM2_NIBAL|nr:Triple QxxK/R motif-containing protein [Nibea albiflora]